MKKFIGNIIRDLKKGENSDLIFTLVLSFILSILNLFGMIKIEIIFTLLLITLSLMSASMLNSRYKMDQIYKNSNNKSKIEAYDKKLDSFINHMEESKEVYMVGVILRSTITDFFHHFSSSVQKEYKLNVLVSNPDKIDLKVFAKRFSRAATEEKIKSDYDQVFTQLKSINEISSNSSSVNVKLLDFVPSYSMYIFPSTNIGGIIYVELYGYRSKSGSLPKFKIYEKENPDWYHFYKSQFDLMWNDATTLI